MIASAHDGDGNELSRVRLEGPNGYDLTAAFLAWGAERAAAGGLLGDGALGPVDGFGLDELEAAAREYGLTATLTAARRSRAAAAHLTAGRRSGCRRRGWS